MPSAKLDIINTALTFLATNPINSLTDASDEARLVARTYDVLYGAFISGYRWTFCRTTTAQLSKLSGGDTADDYERYALPPAWASIKRVFEGTTGVEIPFRVEGEELITERDVSTSYGLYVTYVSVVDEGKLPGTAALALSMELAGAWAMPLSESNSLAEYWQKQAKEALRNAKWSDASNTGAQALAQVEEYTMISER